MLESMSRNKIASIVLCGLVLFLSTFAFLGCGLEHSYNDQALASVSVWIPVVTETQKEQIAMEPPRFVIKALGGPGFVPHPIDTAKKPPDDFHIATLTLSSSSEFASNCWLGTQPSGTVSETWWFNAFGGEGYLAKYERRYANPNAATWEEAEAAGWDIVPIVRLRSQPSYRIFLHAIERFPVLRAHITVQYSMKGAKANTLRTFECAQKETKGSLSK